MDTRPTTGLWGASCRFYSGTWSALAYVPSPFFFGQKNAVGSLPYSHGALIALSFPACYSVGAFQPCRRLRNEGLAVAGPAQRLDAQPAVRVSPILTAGHLTAKWGGGSAAISIPMGRGVAKRLALFSLLSGVPLQLLSVFSWLALPWRFSLIFDHPPFPFQGTGKHGCVSGPFSCSIGVALRRGAETL